MRTYVPAGVAVLAILGSVATAHADEEQVASELPPLSSTVLLHARGERGELQAEAVGFFDQWVDVCVLPCDAAVSIRTRYRVVHGDGEWRPPFVLSGTRREEWVATADRSRTARIAGIVLIPVGAASALLSGWLAGSQDGAGYQVGGLTALTVGVAAFVSGLVLYFANAPKPYRVVPVP